MRKVGGDSRGSTDIEEGELGDKGVLLEEKREGLSDSTCSMERKKGEISSALGIG